MPADIRSYPIDFTLPNLSFHKKLMLEYGVGTDSIAYISDNLSFLRNTKDFIGMTVLLRRGELIYSETGFCPDMICGSLADFLFRLLRKDCFYYGDAAIRKLGEAEDKIQRKPITTSIEVSGKSVKVIAAGRYFGSNHYLSAVDRYSYVIAHNKYEGRKLYGRFDDVLSRIFSKLIKAYSSFVNLDFFGLCNVPDKPKNNKFEKISPIICEYLGIMNLSNKLICIRDYPDNKNLSNEDRIKNVLGAFRYTGDLSGKRVALIDDIITTGATVSECCRILFDKGAEEVVVFVLGINQFACNYWSDMFHEFKGKHDLRYNSDKRIPFFSGKPKPSSYEEEINKLILKLDKEIISFDDDTTDSCIPF